jgi:hypothetical protein
LPKLGKEGELRRRMICRQSSKKARSKTEKDVLSPNEILLNRSQRKLENRVSEVAK